MLFLKSLIFTFFLFGSVVALPAFLPESLQVIKSVPMNIGGACAIFFLFLARNHFSRLMTLHGFGISTLFLFLRYHVYDLDVAILLVITYSASFFLSLGFRSSNEDTNKTLESTFLFLVAGRLFVAAELFPWEMAFLMQLVFLFILDLEAIQEKRRVFFTLLLLLLMGSCSFSFYGPGMNPVILIILGSAAAGAVGFLYTTGEGQIRGVFLYLLSNITLGFLLKEEGKTLPEVTLVFIAISLMFIFFMYIVSLIKGESFSKVLSESKSMLLKPFFTLLFLLNHAYLSDSGLDLDPWISSMAIQICILLFLIFIMKKERKD